MRLRLPKIGGLSLDLPNRYECIKQCPSPTDVERLKISLETLEPIFSLYSSGSLMHKLEFARLLFSFSATRPLIRSIKQRFVPGRQENL